VPFFDDIFQPVVISIRAKSFAGVADSLPERKVRKKVLDIKTACFIHTFV
jgi:hypothetical protein